MKYSNQKRDIDKILYISQDISIEISTVQKKSVNMPKKHHNKFQDKSY
jgi:hypothetical protein